VDSKKQKKISLAKYELDYLNDAEGNLVAAKNALAAAGLSKAKRKTLEDDVTFHGAELLVLEENASNGVFRHACSTVVDAHEINRSAPLHYHKL
jgi:hypothetical protein